MFFLCLFSLYSNIPQQFKDMLFSDSIVDSEFVRLTPAAGSKAAYWWTHPLLLSTTMGSFADLYQIPERVFD